MANDTMQNDDETADLRHFEAGQRARDRESMDSGEVLILGADGKTAEECYIAAIGRTVAEANPEYPASDPVVEVAFVADIEDALGIGWDADYVLELYADGDLARARINRYAYPESRLAAVESATEGGEGR